VAHGAISDTEVSAVGRAVLDFSVNTNPLGPSLLAAEALARVDVARYPDPEALSLRRALGERLSVPIESIVVGNGSAELIWLAALAYLRPGDSVLILGPTFGEYERASRIMGARVVIQAARPTDAFQPRLEEAVYYIETYRPRLVFLCNPNNPTGVYLRRPAIERLLRASDEALLVVDEAYLPFAEAPGSPSSSEDVILSEVPPQGDERRI
jgi:histidinol-phosphate/aromatic aminotransferase/cobyric acid decarboxylase-like protein